MATSVEFLMATFILQGTERLDVAGVGFAYYAKGHLVYLLIRQFKLMLEDLSICVELDQAVDLDSGECRAAMQ